MNPIVWRFMGGYATSVAIDAMIPDYYRHIAQGANVAIWGKGTLRGKGAEAVGRGVTKVAKVGSRTVVRFGPTTLIRVGTRFVPIVGTILLIYELGMFLHNNPEVVKFISEHFPPPSDLGSPLMPPDYEDISWPV